MVIRVLTLNICGGAYLDAVISYLQKTSYDIISLQEVAGPDTTLGNVHATSDNFAILTEALKDKYKGELSVSNTFTISQKAYIGNALFYNSSFECKDKYTLWLKEHPEPIPPNFTNYKELGRNELCITLSDQDIIFSVLNAHLAWANTPQEHDYQREQNRKLVEYVSQLKTPFILTGDFNITPDQPSILDLKKIATSATEKFGITNTLNPRLHRVKKLFPKGLAVDYIFVSKNITVQLCRAVSKDLSDHLGIEATITMEQ